MIDLFIEAVKTNEVMQAALVAAPATAITYALRNVPASIWNTIKRWCSYDLTFRSDQDEYYYVNRLVSEKLINPKLSRDYAYDVVTLWDDKTVSDEQVYTGISLGYGTHWGKYEGHFLSVDRSFEEANQSDAFKETLVITFYGLSSKPAERFCKDVAEEMAKRKEDNRVRIKIGSGGGWHTFGYSTKRPLNSVFTNGDTLQHIVNRINKFQKSKDETIAKGLPYHLGVLLTGPPGTGKTSVIHAIASHFSKQIRFISLGSLRDDSDLTHMMSGPSDWNESIVVIEDIDVAGVPTDRDSDTEGVTMAGLLNVLDGFLTPEGMIVIATTNHPEKLDPALTRSGRFDYTAHLGPLDWENADAMAQLLLGKDNSFSKTYKERYHPVVGADLRERLLSGEFK